MLSLHIFFFFFFLGGGGGVGGMIFMYGDGGLKCFILGVGCYFIFLGGGGERIYKICRYCPVPGKFHHEIYFKLNYFFKCSNLCNVPG